MSAVGVQCIEDDKKAQRGQRAVDAHAHLDPGYFEEPVEEVLERATEAGVSRIIVVGCGVESSENAVRLARENPERLHAVVGIHPHDASEVSDEAFETIAGLARLPEVVGVGETGLDYHYDRSPREVQREVFRRFLKLAAEVAKPVVVHTREAEEDTLEILRESAPLQASGQLHCFTGSMELAREAIDLGMYVSFSGALTFANADRLRQIAEHLPIERLLVETDCPYMTPAPYRGRPNEPMLVPLVASMLAQVKGISIQEAARSAGRATRRLFGLADTFEKAPLAFGAGRDLLVAVHGEASPEALLRAARRLPMSKIHRIVAFLPEGTRVDSEALEAVRMLALENDKALVEPE
ncbi:MAG: TatD family hydrolase [Verrucomicrobiota bacterium]